MCVGVLGSQKRLSDSLELDLQAVVSFLTWVLGVKLRRSGKAARALKFPSHLSGPLLTSVWQIRARKNMVRIWAETGLGLCNFVVVLFVFFWFRWELLAVFWVLYAWRLWVSLIVVNRTESHSTAPSRENITVISQTDIGQTYLASWTDLVDASIEYIGGFKVHNWMKRVVGLLPDWGVTRTSHSQVAETRLHSRIWAYPDKGWEME